MSDTHSAVANASATALSTASNPSLGMPSSPSMATPSSPAFSSSMAGTSQGIPISQAIHSVNIKAVVPVTLDLQAYNYTKWRTLFRVVLGRFNLLVHVDDSTVPEADPEWIKENLTVITWIYNTIADDLIDMCLKLKEPTAHDIWAYLYNLFSGNKPSRAVHLEAEFHSLVQGDMSAHTYCHRLQQLANALADCDQPVLERTLVHQMIRGLNPKFGVLKSLLPMLPVFPSFIEARDYLLREESARAAEVKIATETALVAAGTAAPAADSSALRSDTPDRSTNNDRGRGRGRRGGRGRGRNGNYHNNSGSGGRGSQPPYPQWPQPFLPYGMPWGGIWRSPWTGATGPSANGSRQQSSSGHAYPAYQQPTTVSAPPSFDTNSLIHALHAASLHQPGPPEWIMDTGASSHMTGDQGSNQQDRHSEVQ